MAVPIFPKLTLLICIFVAVGASAAQDIDPDDVVPSSVDLFPDPGDSLFGDSVDLNTGRVSIRHVDISLPGNSDLPVEVSRIASSSKLNSADFSGWSLDLPSLSASSLDTLYFSMLCDPDRADSLIATPNIIIPGGQLSDYVHYSQYWSGLKLHIPGEGDQIVLRNSSSSAYPGRFITTKNWTLDCYSPDSRSMVATSPEGTQYLFNIFRDFKSDKYSINVSFEGFNTTYIPVENVLFPSRVTDLSGNFVEYYYDAPVQRNDIPADSNSGLREISSSDGREISLIRNNEGKVESISSNDRSWRYFYDSDGGHLSQVELPDGSNWEISSVFALTRSTYLGDPGTEWGDVVVKHPSGATLQMSFETIYVGRNTTTNGAAVGGSTHPSIAMMTKEISGPGFSNQNYTYWYDQTMGQTKNDPGEHDRKVTSVTLPDGSREKWT